jgi:hypothetical protein
VGTPSKTRCLISLTPRPSKYPQVTIASEWVKVLPLPHCFNLLLFSFLFTLFICVGETLAITPKLSTITPKLSKISQLPTNKSQPNHINYSHLSQKALTPQFRSLFSRSKSSSSSSS